MKQAYFVSHAPCPHCNSKDNLALYSDGGGYCFGCGYVQKKKVSGYVTETNEVSISRPSVSWLVGEEIPSFGEGVVEWLNTCPENLIPELLRRGVTTVKGNPNSILFQWFSESRFPCLQQVRYFPSDSKRKYITYGKPAEVLPIYYTKADPRNGLLRVAESLLPNDGVIQTDTNGDKLQLKEARLVIVEDALSAIKMAHSVDSMPCLGSDLPPAKITALSRFYEEIVVWLDGNMFHKAQKIAQRFQLLGLHAKAVYTEDDPKCYTYEQMKKIVEGA